MTSDGKSRKGYQTDSYDATLDYLQYEGTSNRISVPIRIRERHLTPGKCPAQLQAIGTELQAAVWSERDNILIRMPLTEWKATRPYKSTLGGPNDGHISVGRFEDVLSTVREPESGESGISAEISTHELPKPKE